MLSEGLLNKGIINTVHLFLLVLMIVLPGLTNSQIDKRATPETKILYRNLFSQSQKGVMFGHQDALAYGLNSDHTRWIGGINKSDIKTLTGEHPAVVGHDLGHLELDKEHNLDDVPFENMRQSIQTVYAYGGVNTLSWHPNNPLDLSKTTWDKMDFTIRRIMEDKKNLKSYKKTLNKLAGFFKSLKGPGGELIPVIFRPYHEHTGSWFWWGADHCTPDEYKAFWQMTVRNLVRKNKVHNLLFAYSTDNFRSEPHYLERYPGDEYIDLLGFDTYHRNAPQSDSAFIANTKRMVATIKKLAQEKNKLYAITETGLEKVGETDWWTRVLFSVIQDTGLSYVLVWRNGRPDHFYAPFEGQSSAADFKTFFNYPATLFEKDVSELYKP
jgi:mannan endo-1,4-beta-mannosidase